MKLIVILFCVLLFSSKIVDSIPHSEGHLRHRVNPPSIWQGNQNAQDAQYLGTDFTQTRKTNTLTNSAIQQESIHDYDVNQGRHNYNRHGYNESPASQSLGKERESYNLQTNGHRLESYAPRVESYPTEVEFGNQPLRKQNRRPQKLYTNSVPNAVLITDNERPLVNTVQEPYHAPVQYLEPKYIPSANRRFYQPDRSYQIREQLQYPLANNAGDSKYVANAGPRFESSGPVLYENYNEGQARVSEIKAKLTDGQRYLQNLAPQSANYNVIPVVIATDTLTDQSENIKYLENYRSRSDLSNTASSTNYEGGSPTVENYSLDSRLSNVPEYHESYRESQPAVSEIKTRLSDDRRHTQSFAPQSEIIYNESPADIATENSGNQFQNVKSIENYRSRSDLSETVQKINYDEDSSVISAADNYNLHSRPINGPVSYERYSDGQPAESEVNPGPIESQRYVHNFAPQPRIIYNDIPAVIATDVLGQSSPDQFSNIKHEEREEYKSPSHLSNNAPTTNYDADSSVISAAENRKYLHKVAPQSRIIYNNVPAVIVTHTLPDQSNNIRYEEREEYKSRSDLSNTEEITKYDSSVISAAETYNEGSIPSNNPIPHDKYGNIHDVLSEVRPKPISDQNYLQKVASQSRIINNDDSLVDQSNNNRYEKKEEYISFPDLSNIEPVTSQDDSSPVIPDVDNTDSNLKPSNPAPEIIKTRSPLEVNKILSDKPLARRYAHNYRPETRTTNIVRDNSFDGAPNVISETVEEKSVAYEDNYGQNEPIPIDAYSETSPTSTHTITTNKKINKIEESDMPLHGSSSPIPLNNPNMHHKIKELNLNKFSVQKLKDGSTKPYLVIHPNGTVEHLDTIDLESQPNSYLRLVNTKRINEGDMEDEETQSPELVSTNISKNILPQNETPLPVDTQPSDYVKSTILHENQENSAYESDSKVFNKGLPADESDLKPLNSNQQVYGDNIKPLTDDDNPNLPLVNQRGDGDKFKPLRPYIRHRTHHHKSKPTDVNQLPFDSKSNPSILDENQLADEKSKPNGAYLSSLGENQPSDVNTANLPLIDSQSGNDKDSEPLSRRPYKKRPHIHHHKSKLPSINQPTEDSIASPSSNDNQPIDDNNYKTLPLNENQPKTDIDSQTLHLHKRKPSHHYTSKNSHLNQPRDVNIISSLSPSENKVADDNDSNLSSSGNIKSTNENLSELSNESQLENDKLKPTHTRHLQLAHHSKPKLTHEKQSDKKSLKNKPVDDENSKSSLLDENKSANDDNSPKNKPEEDNKSKPLSPHKKQPALHSMPTLSHKEQSEIDEVSSQNKSEDDNNSNSRSPGNNLPTDDNISENKLEDDKISNPHQRKPAHHNKPKLSHKNRSDKPKDKPKDGQNIKSSSPDDFDTVDDDILVESKSQNKNKPIHPHNRKPADRNEPKPSYKDQSEKDDSTPQNKPKDDVNSNPSFSDDNELIDDDTLPRKRHPGKHNKRNQSKNKKNSPKDEPRNNNNPSSSLDNKSTDYDTYPENKPGDNIKSIPLKPHKRKPEFYNKTKLPYEDQPRNDANSPKDKSKDKKNVDSTFLDNDEAISDETFSESQPGNNNKPKPDHDFYSSSPDDNESIDDDTYFQSRPQNNKKNKPKHPKRQPAHYNEPNLSQEDESEYDDTFSENESEDDVDSNPWLLDEEESEEDDTYSQYNPEDSVASPAGEYESEHSKKQTTVMKTDDQPASTTLLLNALNYTKPAKPQVAKKHKHSQKSTTNSPIDTTPSPNETSEDQIITLSPIEQATDNVSDAPLVTTTAKPPTKTPGKSDTIKVKQTNSANSSPEDFAAIKDRVQTSKTSTSSSTTQTDSISDSKTTKVTVLNKNTQTNGNADENQVKRKVQSAVYDSSELLDTNTDVLAESDNNSPVTKSPSVQSDVNTGDASDANILEFEQPETEIIITVSSSTDNDSEDDIITINVEVFESTGSFSTNKSLLVNIDTNNDSDDDSERPQPSDCGKDQNGEDDGKGKNIEIDLSNIQGEPTMWIRTTNKDFIDQLMNKNDTAFDMVYFFNIVSQPVVEREKLTTIHCNGTVVIETKEITYDNKDDKTPTIVKTTQTMQIEEYKRLDSLND
ncbi:hypothetical protein PYW08_014941 [Mythimna loreyi]|uniref:Uncharacterized protein n=1 Tax=Mythimna loreyi TaxID=667449 RepID=A0ACC2R7L5_9NEOP|nr:hypothetical protein PYW08_014941 [Mythimna loreyi]